MKRRLKKAPASEGGRYKGVRAARDGEGGGCAKIHGLCKQELLDCRRSEKTTLFRILTKAHVDTKSGQTAHVGVAKVPEPRLLELAKLYNPKKVTYATVQYVDLPGVQKERMRESLATLRDVDAIAHVIRVFDDPSVPHSEGGIDPLRDATNLDLELILSDHDQISKRLERVEKDLKKKKDPLLELEKNVLEKCKAHLEAEKTVARVGTDGGRTQAHQRVSVSLATAHALRFEPWG